jgi:large subunit ribosomal protein L18
MSAHKKIRNTKVKTRLRRKYAIRSRIQGTTDKPRLSVFRSLKHIYVQAIDDTTNQVLASASDMSKDLRGGLEGKSKKERAREVGKALGAKLLEKDVKKVVFDRNGFIYHGRVKEVAEGAREAGLEF